MPETNLAVLLLKLEPALNKAFLEALELVKSDIQIARLTEALQRNDINAAMDALSFDPAVFRAFEKALAEAYESGGDAGMGSLPRIQNPVGGRFVFRFGVRNPRAEQWLRNHSSNLITRIAAEQREVVRTALVAGLERGANPRSTALDIAGRFNRATQRREGGLLGLSAPQAEYVTTARNELLSGNPDQMRNYLTRKRRDKRFDSVIKRAIKDESPVPVDTVTRATGRYSDQLLRLRAETIARTETLASLHAGQDEAFRQAIDAGAVQSNQVRRIWRSAGDGKVRDSHNGLNGESVGLNERFSNGLMYPGDPSGAASEVINCRCVLENRIDFLGNLPPSGDATVPQMPTLPPLPPVQTINPLPDVPDAAKTAKFITQNNIAEQGSSFKGFDQDGLAEMLTTQHEINSRFSMKKLSAFGNNGWAANKGVGLKKLPGTTPAWFGMKHNIMGFNSIASSRRGLRELSEISTFGVKRNLPKRLAEIDTIKDAALKRRALAFADDFKYQAADPTPSFVVAHENGHRLHANYFKAVEKSIEGWEQGWQHLLSQYGSTNKYEFVAESFALYNSDKTQHWRIKPDLLKLFKDKDLSV